MPRPEPGRGDLPGAQPLQDELASAGRIRLAPGRLHDRAHQRADRRRLALADLGGSGSFRSIPVERDTRPSLATGLRLIPFPQRSGRCPRRLIHGRPAVPIIARPARETMPTW